jgi:acetyl-CoA carboxylase beta subunit
MPDRLSAREVLALVADADSFRELPSPPGESRPDGPLGWQGYDTSRARAAERTGEQESVVCGTASVAGTRAVLIAFEFGFLGGSLGERTGDRLVAAYTHAREHRLPVVPLIATGGSRMQEGMLALTQLQRVARQSALTRAAGLPQIAVLRDPTTGGGWATLGAGADVVLALPDAQVGFAGSRVRPPGADPSAYTAQAQVAAGSADAVVPVQDLRATLGKWLTLLTDRPAPTSPGAGSAPETEGALGDSAATGPATSANHANPAPGCTSAGDATAGPGLAADTPPGTAPGGIPGAEGAAGGSAATGPVDHANSSGPAPGGVPGAEGALGGSAGTGPAAPANNAGPAPDAAGTGSVAGPTPAADTPPQAAAGSVPGGEGALGGPAGTGPAAPANDAGPAAPAGGSGAGIGPAPVPFALGAVGLPGTGWDAVGRARAPERPRARAYLDAYFTYRVLISGDRCGGSDPDGMLCGFGERDGRTVAYAAQTGTATRPAGYRTAARLIRLADRLGIPVLTLVDTPGAANGAEAEREGAGAAIAEVFGAVAAARVPVTTLVIGEGGSGGALALAAPGNTWATPDSYFSVIAPELAAAILKRPPGEVRATADQLRIRPQDLVELGVVRGIARTAADHPGA